MSAEEPLNVHIVTRGWSQSPTGVELLENSLLVGIAGEASSMLDQIKAWAGNKDGRKGVGVSSSFGFGPGKGGYMFTPGVSQNLYSRRMMELNLGLICQDFGFPPGLEFTLVQMLRQDVYGADRHAGVWEFLIIAETPPEAGKHICDFELVVCRIQRHRATFNDRVLTKRGASLEWFKVDGSYNSKNVHHSALDAFTPIK